MRLEHRDATGQERQSVDRGEEPVGRGWRHVAVASEPGDRCTGRQRVVEGRRAQLSPARDGLRRERPRSLVAEHVSRRQQTVDRNGIAPVPAEELPVHRAGGRASQRCSRLLGCLVVQQHG